MPRRHCNTARIILYSGASWRSARTKLNRLKAALQTLYESIVSSAQGIWPNEMIIFPKLSKWADSEGAMVSHCIDQGEIWNGRVNRRLVLPRQISPRSWHHIVSPPLDTRFKTFIGRLSWLHVSFWAHVNIVHHIISYHIISSLWELIFTQPIHAYHTCIPKTNSESP